MTKDEYTAIVAALQIAKMRAAIEISISPDDNISPHGFAHATFGIGEVLESYYPDFDIEQYKKDLVAADNQEEIIDLLLKKANNS